MKRIVLAIVLLIGIVNISHSQNNQFEQKNTAYVIKDGIQIDNPKLAIEYLNNSIEKVNNIINRSLAPVEKVKVRLLVINNKISRKTYLQIDEIYKNLF